MCPSPSVYEHCRRTRKCDQDGDGGSVPREPRPRRLVKRLRRRRSGSAEVGRRLRTRWAHRLWEPGGRAQDISDLVCEVGRMLLDVVGDAVAVMCYILRHRGQLQTRHQPLALALRPPAVDSAYHVQELLVGARHLCPRLSLSAVMYDNLTDDAASNRQRKEGLRLLRQDICG